MSLKQEPTAIDPVVRCCSPCPILEPSTYARSVQAYTAYALFKAFEGVGTDNDRVTRLLGGTDKKKMGAVASYYLSTYGNSLVEDLKDELSGTFLKVRIFVRVCADVCVCVGV